MPDAVPGSDNPGPFRIPGQVFRRLFRLACLLAAGFCFWQAAPGLLRDDGPASPAVAKAVTVDEAPRGTLVTTPIQNVRVGDRVRARNPEISDDERRDRTEPDWSGWLLGTLEMPKDDGGILHVEILRPRSWWIEHTTVLVATISAASHPGPENTCSGGPDAEKSVPAFQPVPLGPQVVPLGLAAELSLHEMGAAGLALVTDINPSPEMADGEGQVVTATFRHPPSTTVLDVTFAGGGRQTDFVDQPKDIEPEPIGVTDKHLFWSVDREEFVAIGEMEIGERTLTWHGETRRLASRVPRPGPQTVYNLEVYEEHVYFAGDGAILVHNSYAPSGVTPFNDGQMLQLTKKYSRLSQTDGARADRYLAAKLQQGFITQEQAQLIGSIKGMKFIEKGPGTQMHHLFPQVMGSRIPRDASSPYLYSAAPWEHSILHTALDHHFSNPALARSITINGKTAIRTLKSAQYYRGRSTVIANWTPAERIAIMDDFFVNFADGAYLQRYLRERLITLAEGID